MDIEYDQSNKGNPWTDDELKIVFQFAPTKANCLLLAKGFKRGYGSIEQIYRWAATTQKEINRKKSDNVFVSQLRRIAKEVGWRV